MGFFSQNEDVPKLPPNKSKRKECWESRDQFFECLTKNKIDNSLDPKEQQNVESNCGKLRKEFEGKCVASWVKHFQDKRFNDLTRARYIEKLEAEGAQQLPFKLDNRK
ncbi:putative cytochrome c oxidase subunit Vib [Suhomyces tanzawaensis NRRL Y-17324]|uniref:Putative cytochrome c oxidase subunit Vib n=1 Tax=Suhomyces tanzawaensis NRRL Y-17324 TaxID=984487 RepID=A0A1E4SJA5_9ASCO|nr:putative cytochrome c oxidase subunit Vib [Suhomyces tanzawaensis NRRL Y-17324]ODV79595.1 putative cytochrome c oxidase subunit Vib [Suhomyces tanzawaensis NRRL Y-17324]